MKRKNKADPKYKPADVVFALIRGYPWWPAIVGRSFQCGRWERKDGCIWVYFIDEDEGAWVKASSVHAYSVATSDALKTKMLAQYPNLKDTIKDAYYLASQFIGMHEAGYARDVPFVFNKRLKAEDFARDPPAAAAPANAAPTATATIR